MPAEEGVSDELVVVVSGGEAPPVSWAASLVPDGAPVVVADRGLDHALALGLDVAIAVGDFDSASPEAIARAESAGALVVKHPAEKDATDLELALDAAIGIEPQRILVLAGDGGRLDHQLSTLLLLASQRYASATVDAIVGQARVHVVRGERELEGVEGELVSLLALHGPAQSVTTEGLVFPLRAETLEPGSSRGVSNVFEGKRARVTLESGVLLAIRPGWEP
jgi:thiamine pyrophosphokinase